MQAGSGSGERKLWAELCVMVPQSVDDEGKPWAVGQVMMLENR